MLPLVCPLCRIALPPLDDVCPRDGQRGREAAWLPVPRVLGQRFQVIAPYARGDTSSLYLVDEPATGRRGLLKLLQPVSSPQLVERQRLRRELVKQATLARGYLLLPLATGEVDGLTWIFREWLDGVTLEVRLSREGALQQTEAMAIAKQVASALDELHRGGLLHRDVKPGHIFLQPTRHGLPRALLLDAGVTGLIPARSATPLYGTAGYAAPEQLVGKLVSFRSDLYSLGCVLYRMLTGRPAFLGDSLDDTLTAQRYGELPPMPPDLPHGIGALLRSILSKDPQERPFSAQNLRRMLDPFLPDGALMEKQPTTTFETLPEPRPSTAPEPTGTLRPPPPPSMRPDAPPAPTGGTLRPRAGDAARAAPKKERKSKREERTQQVELEEIEELVLEELQPAAPRTISVPPPVPTTAASSRPPARGPELPSDKTQPIRLDQILSIAATRRAATTPPPPSSSLPPPRASSRPPARREQARVAPERLVKTDARREKHESEHIHGGASARLEAHDESASHQASPAASAAVPLTDASSAELDALLASRKEAAGVVIVPHAAPTDALEHKATLLGLGDATIPSAAPFPESTAEPAERDHPTERIPTRQPAPAESPRVASASITGRALALSASLRADPRRLLTYASAALVGLGVLGVGASALLRGSPEPVVGKTLEPSAAAASSAPAAAAAERTAEALAESPRVAVQVPNENDESRGARGAATTASTEPARTASASDRAAASSGVANPGAASPGPNAPPTAAAGPRPGAPSTGSGNANASAALAKAEPSASVQPEAQAPSTSAAHAAEAAAAAKADAQRRAEDAAQKRAEARAARKLAREEARREREAKRSERAKSAKSAKASPADKGGDKSALFAEARDEARTQYAAKHYREAAAAYERAARYDPTNPGIYAGLGAARLQLGEHRAAVQAYQHAVQLSPGSSGFQAALGRAYLGVGEKTKAAAAYKRALAIDPQNEAARSALHSLGG